MGEITHKEAQNMLNKLDSYCYRHWINNCIGCAFHAGDNLDQLEEDCMLKVPLGGYEKEIIAINVKRLDPQSHGG